MLAASFALPTRRDLDARLILGAAIFGVGWGLGGYCPGPGLASLGTGSVPVLAFVGAMLVGLGVTARWEERFGGSPAARSPLQGTSPGSSAAGAAG